ncbi:hypothetical protein C6990_05430 [Nitrosopumilus sp. b3]|uniref:hypothetical protein n=1 Tax=Nitrosopumilus sp. b3 TaxID=2109909 RepID=UPI0015F76C4B|nr:hypothetical protein [Nitrosopumilus sp. b3]KAF6247123.1 hypothetical protein C6990_05430 [Nitrosopumilus sp. b3]
MEKNYIINSENKVIGEAKNYDSHSRKGFLKLYHLGDGDEFRDLILDDDCKIIEAQRIEKEDPLRKSLAEAKYQNWRYQNRGMLQSDYERIRRNLLDFDQFCRGYYVSKHKGELNEFLTSMFSECVEYLQTAFYFDSKRESVKTPQGD